MRGRHYLASGKEKFRANSTGQGSLVLGFDECLHQVAKVGLGIPDRDENVKRHRVTEQHEVFKKFQSPKLLWSKEPEVLPRQPILWLSWALKGTGECMQQ